MNARWVFYLAIWLALAAVLIVLYVVRAHAQTMQVPDPVAHNAASYVVESRCPSDPTNTDPWNCKGEDPVVRYGNAYVDWRKCDWGSGAVDHYQCSDAYMANDNSIVVQTYSYAPFGPWVQANGDGLQFVFVDAANGNIRVPLTQDGSSPSLQWFVGANCAAPAGLPGTGWVLADLSRGTSSVTWTVEVGYLAISLDAPGACPTLAPSLAAWITMNIGYPFRINILGTDSKGRQTTTSKTVWRVVTTSMSEHFDAADAVSSTYMERTMNADRWGMLRWEAWQSPAGTRAPSPDLPLRCPHLDYDSSNDWWPPLDGWTLYDCRTYTNIVPVSGWRGDDFAWGG